MLGTRNFFGCTSEAVCTDEPSGGVPGETPLLNLSGYSVKLIDYSDPDLAQAASKLSSCFSNILYSLTEQYFRCG